MSTNTNPGSGISAERLEALHWRCIGPYRGGRVVAVAGHPVERGVFYFGACAGGVWKTADGGTYWENVSDGYFNTASVGAIAVSQSDPNVVYAGTGEACIRGNVSHGDGVYRSTDGGHTWRNVGLRDSRHIARVRVHPSDPDIAYVAALGHAFGPNDERGVFRTTDGGESWERVLDRGDRAGAADLCMDPGNPRVLYAAMWETLRQPWSFTSGGPGSGIFRSTDGGDTWDDLTGNRGLPEGVKGRIGVAVSPAMQGRVWAIVEAEEGGLYRSDDGGETWQHLTGDGNLMQRPWYYSHVVADPRDANTVWVLNLKAWKSTDGGSTFTQVTTPHGDNHDLWIDPSDPDRMIEGNDGGACVSFNGGESWSSIYNQPTAQLYHVVTDDQFPFRAYGTQQDNSAVSVPSRSIKGAIEWRECERVGNSESGHIAVKHGDPDVVYSGTPTHGGDFLLRYDRRTEQVRIITPWPEFNWGYGVKHHKYRFQWTYPIVASRHDPGVLYVGANVVLRSLDEGSSWEEISPDLTRADETKMDAAGGPITLDTTGPEHYGTIFALAESPLDAETLWAGSDDGLVHLTTNGGATWRNVTPPDMPDWATVSTIDPSPHDRGTAYMAVTRYKLDDYAPLLYRTTDSGRTWTRIADGIREGDFTRVVRADLVRPGLLYAGTETGIYVSFDDGARWQPLQLDLPVAPVHDISARENELVAGTHGRSFWVLDDLTYLRQVDEPEGEKRLFKPADTHRIPPLKGLRVSLPGKSYGYGAAEQATHLSGGHRDGPRFLDAGENPPEGVVVRYELPEDAGEVRLEIRDSAGRLVRGFSSSAAKDLEPGAPEEPVLGSEPGVNVFEWDGRHAGAVGVPGAGAADKGLPGPLAVPGRYEARLDVGGDVSTQPFELLGDPRGGASIDDLEAQRNLLLRIRDRRTELSRAVHEARAIRGQAREWRERASSDERFQAVVEAADGTVKALDGIEESFVQLKADGQLGGISHEARLDGKLAELTVVVSSGDHPPTSQAYAVLEEVSVRLDEVLARLERVREEEVGKLNALIGELGVPAVGA